MILIFNDFLGRNLEKLSNKKERLGALFDNKKHQVILVILINAANLN